ncbi:methylesterase 2-like [Zingiber officinale]|uniref:methylesterase 2-like n=1 Tax=Zingiber officinale TaxID=94328 RepID=UPI001C4DAC04|nr:methylesterase 2-like [Zingiber officinale]
MADARSNRSHHIVFVHGVSHGAWCWYKLISLLGSAGHRVTALDLAASGIDERRFSDLRNFADYNQPLIDLLAALPQGERIVLVSHTLGGLNIAFAMDRFPHKVAVGVFVTAFLPDTVHPPS